LRTVGSILPQSQLHCGEVVGNQREEQVAEPTTQGQAGLEVMLQFTSFNTLA
jgi:hypothetical protein